MEKERVFGVFSNCIPVKGHSRSMIYDLQRGEAVPVPNILPDLMKEWHGLTLKEIEEKYTEEELSYVNQYLNLLLEKEFIFWVTREEIEQFPKLSMEWDYPAQISTVVSEGFNIMRQDVFDQVDELGVNTLVVVLNYFLPDEDNVRRFLERLSQSAIQNTMVIWNVPDKEWVHQSVAFRLLYDHGKITKQRVYYAPKKETKGKTEYYTGGFEYNREPIQLNSPSISIYTEAKKHNTYFNRKLFLLKGGIISNSYYGLPYGNVDKDRLTEVIEKSGFKDLWNAAKDETLICNECEFRYCCVDSRVPIRNDDGFWEHTTECGYDPYTATWIKQKNEIAVL